jgi:hypothetical protein
MKTARPFLLTPDGEARLIGVDPRQLAVRRGL